jgi:hypothetical protein
MKRVLLFTLLLVAIASFAVVVSCGFSGDDNMALFDGYGWELVSQQWSNGKNEPVTLNMEGLFIEGDGSLTYGAYNYQWVTMWQNGRTRTGEPAPDNLWGPEGHNASSEAVGSKSSFVIRHVNPRYLNMEPYDEISFDMDEYGYFIGTWRFIYNGDSFTITNAEGTKYLRFKRKSFVKSGGFATSSFD